MKIHALGYWGTFPAPGEATTGYLVETTEGKVLVDCGSGVLAQLQYVCQVADLAAVIITHHHFDHIADLGVLSYAALMARTRGLRTEPIPVYLPEGSPELTEQLRAEPLLRVERIDAGSKLSIAGMDVSFAETVHPVYCLAVKMVQGGRTFVFSADTSVCPPLEAFAAGADLFICEASMFIGQEEAALRAGHLTSRQAGELARRAGAKRLVLTHYPRYGDVDQLLREASEAFGAPVPRLSPRMVLEV
ncbi:hypothetical protein GCM10010885_07290 [Alicyclobacillus cellulosilyticus]|uniref:Metallo-beta-lactamase domain-containing protein n=1 Tax=Alicyclobacillus cellulosilyticus TaxID=1003997 RepID=A0A917K7L7_9BACL|nr:MBL fold metallo-hydrolase [Alicyclobacillus cellulosilyticus]GGJ00620.1 hypothetical protein GCM10010885_07290 [Alicyclobacillus cellulosilyticus]